jgi:hypothetical protein
MTEFYQGLYYFRHFKKDDWKLKVNSLRLRPNFPRTQFLLFFLQTLVTVALLVDTVSIVADYSSVYLVSVRILYWTTQDSITVDIVHDYTCRYVSDLSSPLNAYWMLAGDLEYLRKIHWVRQFHMYPECVSHNHLADTIIFLYHWRA